MHRNTRCAVGTILSAALIGGFIPPEAAAQVAPTALGASASTGGSAAAAGSAAAFSAPAPLGASALIPSASLSASPLGLLPDGIGRGTSSPYGSVAAAPSAVPSLAAAAAGPQRETPNSPKAAAPAARASWLKRAAKFLTGSSDEAPAPKTDAAAKAEADRLFDGAAGNPVDDGAPAVSEAAARAKRAEEFGGRLGRWTQSKLEAYQARRALTHDAFGGPKNEPMSFARKIGYGVKWGLNLVGLSAILDFTLAPLLSHVSWPLLFSSETLHQFGRIELLTKFGPPQIATLLATHPLSFLGIALPASTAMEEFAYRFLGFGLTFAVLAFVKPAAESVSRLLDQVPDASGLRSTVQRVLTTGGRLVAYYAFPIAALKSALSFAGAHFAMWGVDPMIFAMNLIAGYALARVAYKTRGLTAPFVAHLVFNLTMLGGLAIGTALGMPLAAAIYSALAAIAGLVALWYDWRSARKDRAFALKGLKNGALGLMIAALIGGSALTGLNAPRDASALASYRPAAHATLADSFKATAAAEAAAPATAADSAAPAASVADMVARMKPSVVQIVVKTAQGVGIGSGVIVSPDGRIVTNAHVVGDRRPGQLVVVELVDGHKLPGKVLAVNHDRDIAFVQLPKLRRGSWPVSPFAQTAPREGDPVFAMGHPRGLPFTVSHGVVSGLGARGNMYVQYLQTDAPINPGNSGGPLFNANGEIVGINTMIFSQSGGSEGLGFSIIAPSVVQALAQYDATGGIATAALGVIADLSSPDQPEQGIAVEAVRPGSAAAKAGVKPGDLIVGLAGVELREGGRAGVQELSAILAKAKPGDQVEIAVVRGDAVTILKVTLNAKATTEESSAAHGLGADDGE